MEKLKKIYIVLILIILSGCTVKSDVVMDSTGKVSEKVSFLVETDGRSKEEINKYFDGLYEVYAPALKAINYSTKVVYDRNNSEILVTNEFDDICEYFRKTIFSQYIYNHISCTETEYYYEIKNESEHIDYCPDCTSWPALDDVSFSIKLPINAAENDADYVNKRTYTWEFNENTPKEKNIYLKINKSDLEENKEKVVRNEKIKNVLEKVSYVIVIIIILALIGFGINKLYKKYLENKIEY